MGGYIGVKCKQKGVNGRVSEQKNLMDHVKCKQKGMNGRLSERACRRRLHSRILQ